jgi:omega-amidase
MREQLKISAIQTHLYWENRTQNLQHFTQLISTIQNADIIVLPETFTTGFSMNNSLAESDRVTLDWMKNMAAQKNAAIAGSFFVNENGKNYNRLHFVEPNGNVTIYNKKHLFCLTNEQEVFSSGNEQVIVNYKGWNISLLVCYDLRFPVWLRRTHKNDYDLLLLVANWPERRSYAWNQLLVARAIENQSYLVGVNRVGNDGTGVLYGGESVVLDAMGQPIIKGEPFKEEIIECTLDYTILQSIRKNLPFYEDGDDFEWE